MREKILAFLIIDSVQSVTSFKILNDVVLNTLFEFIIFNLNNEINHFK